MKGGPTIVITISTCHRSIDNTESKGSLIDEKESDDISADGWADG